MNAQNPETDKNVQFVRVLKHEIDRLDMSAFDKPVAFALQALQNSMVHFLLYKDPEAQNEMENKWLILENLSQNDERLVDVLKGLQTNTGVRPSEPAPYDSAQFATTVEELSTAPSDAIISDAVSDLSAQDLDLFGNPTDDDVGLERYFSEVRTFDPPAPRAPMLDKGNAIHDLLDALKESKSNQASTEAQEQTPIAKTDSAPLTEEEAIKIENNIAALLAIDPAVIAAKSEPVRELNAFGKRMVHNLRGIRALPDARQNSLVAFALLDAYKNVATSDSTILLDEKEVLGITKSLQKQFTDNPELHDLRVAIIDAYEYGHKKASPVALMVGLMDFVESVAKRADKQIVTERFHQLRENGTQYLDNIAKAEAREKDLALSGSIAAKHAPVNPRKAEPRAPEAIKITKEDFEKNLLTKEEKATFIAAYINLARENIKSADIAFDNYIDFLMLRKDPLNDHVQIMEAIDQNLAGKELSQFMQALSRYTKLDSAARDKQAISNYELGTEEGDVKESLFKVIVAAEKQAGKSKQKAVDTGYNAVQAALSSELNATDDKAVFTAAFENFAGYNGEEALKQYQPQAAKRAWNEYIAIVPNTSDKRHMALMTAMRSDDAALREKLAAFMQPLLYKAMLHNNPELDNDKASRKEAHKDYLKEAGKQLTALTKYIEGPVAAKTLVVKPAKESLTKVFKERTQELLAEVSHFVLDLRMRLGMGMTSGFLAARAHHELGEQQTKNTLVLDADNNLIDTSAPVEPVAQITQVTKHQPATKPGEAYRGSPMFERAEAAPAASASLDATTSTKTPHIDPVSVQNIIREVTTDPRIPATKPEQAYSGRMTGSNSGEYDLEKVKAASARIRDERLAADKEAARKVIIPGKPVTELKSDADVNASLASLGAQLNGGPAAPLTPKVVQGTLSSSIAATDKPAKQLSQAPHHDHGTDTLLRKPAQEKVKPVAPANKPGQAFSTELPVAKRPEAEAKPAAKTNTPIVPATGEIDAYAMLMMQALKDKGEFNTGMINMNGGWLNDASTMNYTSRDVPSAPTVAAPQVKRAAAKPVTIEGEAKPVAEAAPVKVETKPSARRDRGDTRALPMRETRLQKANRKLALRAGTALSAGTGAVAAFLVAASMAPIMPDVTQPYYGPDNQTADTTNTNAKPGLLKTSSTGNQKQYKSGGNSSQVQGNDPATAEGFLASGAMTEIRNFWQGEMDYNRVPGFARHAVQKALDGATANKLQDGIDLMKFTAEGGVWTKHGFVDMKNYAPNAEGMVVALRELAQLATTAVDATTRTVAAAGAKTLSDVELRAAQYRAQPSIVTPHPKPQPF